MACRSQSREKRGLGIGNLVQMDFFWGGELELERESLWHAAVRSGGYHEMVVIQMRFLRGSSRNTFLLG